MTGTVPCPYCERPVERTVDHTDAYDRWAHGEYCLNCFLPFGVAADGSAYGQDDPRFDAPAPDTDLRLQSAGIIRHGVVTVVWRANPA